MKSRIRRSRQGSEEPQSRSRIRRRRTPPSVGTYLIDWSLGWGAKLQLYLMASFLYYKMNRSVITDYEYDRLCQELLEGWRVHQHQHKHLVTRGDLEAGTGYAIQYPTMVRNAAMLLLDTHGEVR